MNSEITSAKTATAEHGEVGAGQNMIYTICGEMKIYTFKYFVL